jgi:hypothetical protein
MVNNSSFAHWKGTRMITSGTRIKIAMYADVSTCPLHMLVFELSNAAICFNYGEILISLFRLAAAQGRLLVEMYLSLSYDVRYSVQRLLSKHCAYT